MKSFKVVLNLQKHLWKVFDTLNYALLIAKLIVYEFTNKS